MNKILKVGLFLGLIVTSTSSLAKDSIPMVFKGTWSPYNSKICTSDGSYFKFYPEKNKIEAYYIDSGSDIRILSFTSLSKTSFSANVKDTFYNPNTERNESKKYKIIAKYINKNTIIYNNERFYRCSE